jgi:hypothetical protein
MLCTRCEGDAQGAGMSRRREARCGTIPCERCGAAILTLAGVAVGVGNATLASLARFGLASTGQPLLEPRQGGA